jgi:rhodanese-related sulfurtransferase
MEQFIEFATEQWFLLVALVFIVAMLAHSYLGSWGIKNVPPAEAVELINRKNALVLDVRSDDEFRQGHILNSLHIPVGLLANRIKELEKHRAQPIVVICRSGNRSTAACSTLRKQGFEAVFQLAGGLAAWQNANLPLTKN